MVMLSSTRSSQELTEGYQRLTSSLISTTFVTQELRTSGRPNGVAVGRLRRRALGGLEMTRSDAGDTAFRLCRSSEVIRSCRFCCNVWRWVAGHPREGPVHLSSGDLKQSCDECCLSPDVVATDVPNLAFPQHCHRLVACQCSSGRPEATEAQARAVQPFHVPMVLL
jgi:hypothetical protein